MRWLPSLGQVIEALHDWVAHDFMPLNQAVSEIWTRGNQECVRLANAVVDRSSSRQLRAELGGVSRCGGEGRAGSRLRGPHQARFAAD